MKSKKNWLNKIFRKEKKLNSFLQEITKQRISIAEKRNCFLYFLNSELKNAREQINNKLNENQIIHIQVSEYYGLFYFLQSFSAQVTINLKLVKAFKDAETIALILLRELGQKPMTEPVKQLEKFVQQKQILFIFEYINYIDSNELKILLESLKSAQIILINYSDSCNISLDNLYNLQILPPTPNTSAEFALNMLKLRNDLILTSADKKEISSLINNCNGFPEAIFMTLSTLQSDSSSALGNYAKKTQNLFNYLIQKSFPPEINSLLQMIIYLPSSGFMANDLFVLCKPFINSKENLQIILFFLQNTFCIRKANDIVYQIPDYFRQFLQQDKSNFDLNSINNLLVRRIESNYLWQEKTAWITQLELALNILNYIQQNKDFKSNQYLTLYIQSILLELGFWKIVQNILIPLSEQAIQNSDNNEDRGFWYSLLGLAHLGISKYKDINKHLNLGLNSFQKSLKFYDPQKQPKRYSFVHKNIGLIYYEIYKSNNLNANLKLSIKAYYKALNQDESSIDILRLLSQSYLELAQYEKSAENYQKCFNLYKQALKHSKDDDLTQKKLIYCDLKSFHKKLKGEEYEFLKLQIEEILTNLKSLQ